MNGVRRFVFDRDVTRGEAIRAIVAALDDEELTLTDSDNGRYSAITTVLVDGQKVVLVPAHRIVRRSGPPTLRVVE